MGKYHKARDEAEQEMINTQKDIAETRKEQAEELTDIGTFTEEADKNTAEQKELTEEIEKAVVPTSNKVNRVVQDSQAIEKADNDARQNYRNVLSTKIQNKMNKNQLIMGAKQIASNEAKMKYDIASQRLAQAQAGWGNAASVLQGLGAAISLIPGWGTIVGLGISAAGGAIGAIGSASA